MTVFLHGFWGQPSDWNSVLAKLPLGMPVLIPDLYASGELSPTYELKKWSENFWSWVDHYHGESPVQLVGYSMGARLAVAAAVRNPARVSRALFLSGNPSLASEEFAARESMEQDWAGKFLKQNWNEIERAWDDQPVFTNAQKLERRKSPEMRETLGLSLTRWSPRLHPFTRDDLKSLPSRMEWAFGALDQKYLEVAKSLQELPVQGQITLVDGCGHRLLVEGAEFVSSWLKRAE